MKTTSLFSVLLAMAVVPLASAAVLTVTTTDNASTAGDGQTSFCEALKAAVNGDTIRFNIPGGGPHRIVTPIGGYPLITAHNLTIDGYSQPGALPNTNPILGGNNAQIAIILDSTDDSSAPGDPQDNSLLARRSTRILHSGFGDSENGMLAIFGADNFTVSGLSFIARQTAGSAGDPSIYCVALVNQATNARVQGCWFGLPPGGVSQSDIHGCGAAVAAFRYRTGGDVYSFGLKVGTDGDGVNDRAEFNVIMGMHIALALELPGARISGNYVNVFPNGVTFCDVKAILAELLALGAGDTVENFENGRLTDGTVIGTDGDGVADADERNVFAHAVYDSEIQFYSNGRRTVIAGNYFGVGIDGVTAAPLPSTMLPDLLEYPANNSSIRLGSNGDGVSDSLEGNLIVNVPGSRCIVAGVSIPMVARLNRMRNNTCQAVPFGSAENGGYNSYYAKCLNNSSAGAAPVLRRLDGGKLTGSFSAANATYPNTIIDVYLVDPAALARTNYWPKPLVHPLSLLGSYSDNGPGDLDATPNQFSFDLSSFGLTDATYVAVAVTYSQDAGAFNAGRAITSPMSNPISARPRLQLRRLPEVDQVEVSWLAPEAAYYLQINDSIDNPPNWFEIFGESYTEGRNVHTRSIEGWQDVQFFQLISP